MKVADRLARREAAWKELDGLIARVENAGHRRFGRPKIGAERVLRLGELYRAACADLMLAQAHDLPRETVAYLHALVGRAHNAVYRAEGFQLRRWGAELFSEVPRRLRRDPMLWVAGSVFYGVFLLVALACLARPGLAQRIVGDSEIATMEQMYNQPLNGRDRDDALMAGFYVHHNASIGLQCYAWGVTFGLGTLYVLGSNALILGAVFGHMFGTPMAGNFGTFVTAHGPFELTAIVFSGAAGLRMGWGLIATGGRTRAASWRREARASLPTAGAGVVLFLLAAALEGFVSASPLAYPIKAAIAVASATLLVAYLALGGRRRADQGET